MAMLARSMGTRPEDLPPVERMYESAARTCDIEMPTPPAAREISAHCRSESKMPWLGSGLGSGLGLGLGLGLVFVLGLG